ncbi:hypothetical protein [Lelliottia nimipressuralis]|uniref:hypothetical protein n=1 Tax=Lelliottia nimipressuralis TaxID=69220 RepID=UPI00289E5473|nr:hypothetical protein [Lelliottia nimipressuralis]
MKTTTALYIGRELAAVADYNLVLELSGCGRGFITAESVTDCTGQLVRLDLGMGDTTYRWFTGFVERCGPAENGYKRLFVRELVGALQMKCALSLQHPTLREVCDALGQITGLTITTPERDYAAARIPHFKSAGTGYLAVEGLGAAFSVPDFCWYQLPDGSVFVGSYADSRFAGMPVSLPEEYASSGAAGNSIQMGLVPAIRPGVVVNGQRITKVEATNSEMRLSWVPLNASGQPAYDPPEKRQIDKHYPELAAGLHVPRLARVTGSPDIATLGDVSDPYRPRYAVNLQLLDENGNDADSPEMVSVPLPVPMAGGEGGMFNFPDEGVIVEVGFVDGRPDKPVVRQTLHDGQSLPAISPGEQLQQQRAGVSQRVTRDGSWLRETDQTIEETSAERVIVSDAETRETTRRTTTIKSNDTTTVIGKATLMAGEVLALADGDYCVGATGRFELNARELQQVIAAGIDITAGGELVEKITGIRRSVAAAQVINGSTVNIGDGDINILSCLTDTLDVLQELAELTAQHTHSNTGTPTNSGAISANAQRPGKLTAKYSRIIG